MSDHESRREWRTCSFCNKIGSAKKCAQCGREYYCSVDCQKKAWPQHKAECTLRKKLDTCRKLGIFFTSTEERENDGHLLLSLLSIALYKKVVTDRNEIEAFVFFQIEKWRKRKYLLEIRLNLVRRLPTSEKLKRKLVKSLTANIFNFVGTHLVCSHGQTVPFSETLYNDCYVEVKFLLTNPMKEKRLRKAFNKVIAPQNLLIRSTCGQFSILSWRDYCCADCPYASHSTCNH